MRAALTMLFFVLSILLFESGPSGCGGAASDSPSDVAGVYDCTSGCTQAFCTFDDVITVTQSGDDLIVTADPNDLVGSVNNDGEGTLSSDSVECDFQFVEDRAVGNCVGSDGTDCDQVTYVRR